MEIARTIENRSLKPSVAVIIGITIFCVIFSDFWKNWKKEHTPFVWDVKEYYSYLPATFIYHDLTFRFNNTYSLNRFPKGNVPRATYGMPLMNLPGFLIGWKIAINSKEPVTGFSEAFINSIHFSVLFYVILGLIFLRWSLLRFFNETVVSIGLAAVFLGTNLFFYTMGEGEMPHSYLFFLFSVFIWLSIKWHETPKIRYSIFMGIVLGIITLIRPTEILISIFFIFYGVKSKSSFKAAYQLFLANWGKIALIVVFFLVMWMPQLIYWKMITGKFFFFSYGSQERFYFDNPKIIDVLFSYRKGWFIYTPMMLLAVTGLFFSKKRIPQFNHIIAFYLVINIYLISSWWCWWFGGGFGMRALVQSYSLMAFPLCCFIEVVMFHSFTSKVTDQLVKAISWSLITFLIVFNLMQSYQYINNIIHYDSMTKKVYWLVFCKSELSPMDTYHYWQWLDPAPGDNALKGIR